MVDRSRNATDSYLSPELGCCRVEKRRGDRGRSRTPWLCPRPARDLGTECLIPNVNARRHQSSTQSVENFVEIASRHVTRFCLVTLPANCTRQRRCLIPFSISHLHA